MHVASAAMKSLMQYDWPGNVRELENCVERAVALGNGKVIDLGDLPPSIAAEELLPGSPDIPTTTKSAILDPDLADRRYTTESPRSRSQPPISKTSNEPPSSVCSNRSMATRL